MTAPPSGPSLFVQGVQMALVLLAAPLLTGWIRKVKARLTRRRGPPLLQPYRDLRRLLAKEAVIADNASWLFRAAPYLVLAFTWVAAALVPTFATDLQFSWTGDLIAIIGLLGAARFLLALAGLDVGTSFGGMGASREMMIASLAEPAMLMVVVSLALTAGSTQLSTITDLVLSAPIQLRVSLALALAAFLIVTLAENGRIPVDNPATHLELTMVHEAMVLEYSGRHLAMIELAASLKLLLMLSAILCIFFPFGMPQGAGAISDHAFFGIAGLALKLAAGIASYALKLAVAGALLGVLETAIAKLRVFRVPSLLGGALMLGLLSTLLLYVSRSF